MDPFFVSSFGTFVMGLFQALFTTPSWQSFSVFACGWTFATDRHTITTYLWCTGATTLKPCSRLYAFLGGPLYKARWQRWAQLISQAAGWGPPTAPLVLEIDDCTKKKAGRHIEGLDRYRNSAGTARQAYRTLRGLHFVLGVMRLPLTRWPGHHITLPIGLALSLKAPLASTLQVAYRARSVLARDIVGFVAKTLPERARRVLTDGGYATKDFLRPLPQSAHVISRLLSSAQLSAFPTPGNRRRRGRPPRKGTPLGSPTTLARKRTGGLTHPTAARAKVQAWVGLWHRVLPGRPIRVVVVRRPDVKKTTPASHRIPQPTVAAVFTPDLTLRVAAILDNSRDRWAVAIDSRDGQAYYGLGQDQCRKWRRIVGANTLRLVMAAARTLWVMEQTKRTSALDLCRYRPWYRHQVAPRQLDIVWICRAALHAAGMFPIVRFHQAGDENHDKPANPMPLAA